MTPSPVCLLESRCLVDYHIPFHGQPIQCVWFDKIYFSEQKRIVFLNDSGEPELLGKLKDECGSQ
jgi:hypothetical protein